MFETGLKIFLVSGLLLNIIWVLDTADIIKTPFWKDRNNELTINKKMGCDFIKEKNYNERLDILSNELRQAQSTNEKLDKEIKVTNNLDIIPRIKSEKIIYLDNLKP